MSLSSKEHPSSVSTRAVKSRTSWENGPSPATSESNRPNPMSPATSSPPKEIRARDASDAPISKRNASSSAQPGDPRRLNTLVMRVAGTPRRVASPTTRVADAPAFAPALPTTKQRSQRATTAATASPQCVEVSMKITSATLLQDDDEPLDRCPVQLRAFRFDKWSPQGEPRPHAHRA